MRKNRARLRTILWALVALFSAGLTAQTSYLCCGADTGQIAGVQSMLQGRQNINGTVAQFDAASGTPSLQELQQYDVVLVWSNNVFADPVTLGDNLASYVDGGGHVVIAVFGNFDTAAYPTFTAARIQGRFQNQGYIPIDDGTLFNGTPVSLGTVVAQNHPIMQGVSTAATGGYYWHVQGQVEQGCTEICRLNNNSPLVAINTQNAGGVVSFNWYVPDIDLFSDADELLVNCLNWRNGSNLTPTATQGTATQVYADAQGPNNAGVVAGSFEIANGATQAGILESIEITENGTADASTAISEMKIFRDANSDGMLDAGDVEIGTGSAFNGPDGISTVMVTGSEQNFAVSQTNVYLIVLKLSGTAAPGETLNFIVSDLGVGMGTRAAGVPTSSTIMGLEILAPVFEFTDASSQSSQQVYLGTSDNPLLEFTVEYASGPAAQLNSIEVEFSGVGDDSSAFSRVALIVDTDGDGQPNSANDAEIARVPITMDNGTETFTFTGTNADFTAGTTRRYWLVVDLNATANNSDTFAAQVLSASVTPVTNTVMGLPLPANGPSGGIEVLGNAMVVDVLNPSTTAMVDSNSQGVTGDGELMLDFTMLSTNSTWIVDSFELKANGTADDSVAYSEIGIYQDDGDGIFSGAASELLAGGTTALFAADDGTLTINFQDTSFASQVTRRFFVVAKLSGQARSGQTLSFSIDSFNATPPQGGIVAGLPSPEGTELTINPAAFDVTLNGPGTATTIGNQALAQLLCDVTIEAKNEPYEVSELRFTASGTGDDAAAFSEIALYEDANGSGVFEFVDDTLATSVTAQAFPADDGEYVAMLTDTNFAGSANRRFFLVGSMNGNALANETFNAALTGVTFASPMGASANGVPTMATTALIIDTPVLTIANATAAMDEGRVLDGALDYHLATFLLAASNGDMQVDGITLSLAGSANWVDAVDPSSGVTIYLDSDASGTLDTAADTEIASAGGVAGDLALTFNSPLTIANAATQRIFVEISTVAGLGANTSQTVHSFRVLVASPASVAIGTAGASVMLGTPLPSSGTLTLVEWSVEEVDPLRSIELDGGADITITGSGFTPPISLTIGGVRAGGFANVNADGTTITGLRVPPAVEPNYANLEMVLTTSALGPRTLGVVFNYGAAKSGGGGGGGCALSTQGSTALWLLAALAGLSFVALRFRAGRDTL